MEKEKARKKFGKYQTKMAGLLNPATKREAGK